MPVPVPQADVLLLLPLVLFVPPKLHAEPVLPLALPVLLLVDPHRLEPPLFAVLLLLFVPPNDHALPPPVFDALLFVVLAPQPVFVLLLVALPHADVPDVCCCACWSLPGGAARVLN